MTDELIDRLGTYFVYHKLQERYGWTFERFVDSWRSGAWEQIRKELA